MCLFRASHNGCLRENLGLFSDAAASAIPSFRCLFLCGFLNAPKRVTRTLTAMNDIGVLSAFVPEWEHIVCRWQHVLYHTYTVDVHSIFLVEELRRLWRGTLRPDHAGALGIDAGSWTIVPPSFWVVFCTISVKGLAGSTQRKGSCAPKAALDRLGLEPERAARVLFLVEHHLLMSHLAQSRDISDPKLILELAQLCTDRTNLRNSLSRRRWSISGLHRRMPGPIGKGQLLREVYERTAEMLEIGADDPDKAMELLEARVEVRQKSTREELASLGAGSEYRWKVFSEVCPDAISFHIRPGRLLATLKSSCGTGTRKRSRPLFGKCAEDSRSSSCVRAMHTAFFRRLRVLFRPIGSISWDPTSTPVGKAWRWRSTV